MMGFKKVPIFHRDSCMEYLEKIDIKYPNVDDKLEKFNTILNVFKDMKEGETFKGTITVVEDI